MLGIGPGSRIAVHAEGERLVLERLDTGVAALEGAHRHLYNDDPDEQAKGIRDEWRRG